MPGHVGEDAERAPHQHGRHDRQAIEAIGEVHRVGGADDDEVGERDEAERAQRVRHELEEWDDQVVQGRNALREMSEIRGGRQSNDRLPEKLGLGRKPLWIALHHLAVVVDPADRAERERDQKHHPQQPVGQIPPQERGQADRHQDQRAAHRRRAGLGQMRARALLAHCLADLVRRQLADHVRPEDQRNRERREAGEHRAQRDVVEDVEYAHVLR